ncbi:hypothetical protein [Aeromicrobium fastidiosum]|uniref:hypothetical protein n=1 Tax=Aeromicrobium fastidiosum TaxID=52699 RepID=UPI00165F7CDF|nr:hypothetical protein [Aeromicrobium fastidiosum]MBP2390019.1 hypothetical protein [Aeromicrobium fastidiosum]
MRKTILSRSVVAVATLAIGSVALAATPATAASAQGVTRDEVLTAVNGIRALQTNDTRPSLATNRALRNIATKGCGVSTNFADLEYAALQAADITGSGDDAEGILITARVGIQTIEGSSNDCTIAAFATADGSFQLSGTAQITGTRYNETTQADEPVVLRTQALSGDAFVTTPVDADTISNLYEDSVTASAVGNASKTTTVTTSVKVKDKKTKSEKAKAKTKYTKKIKSVKKSYAKALDKAGNSKSKKAAAKKVYKAKRAAAKASYKYAIAGFKIVKKSSSTTENRPFSVTTPNPRFEFDN